MPRRAQTNRLKECPNEHAACGVRTHAQCRPRPGPARHCIADGGSAVRDRALRGAVPGVQRDVRGPLRRRAADHADAGPAGLRAGAARVRRRRQPRRLHRRDRHDVRPAPADRGAAQIAEQLRRLPLGFYARRQTGDLSAVMAENVVQVEDAFTHLTGELCGRLAIAGLTGALLLSIDWRLGLLAFASVAAGLLLFRLFKRAAGRLGRAKLDQKAETNSRLLEFVQGIKVIRAFGLSAERFDKVFNALTRLRALSVRIEVVAGAAAIGFSVLLEIGFLLVLAQAFRFSLAGHLTHAMLVMFLIMSHRFFSMMSESAMLMAQLAFYSRSFDRIAALMGEPLLPEPDASTAARGCAVEFRDVSFSHAPGEPTLRGVSFVARPDTVTALVGPSGAGKSTLAHLVARFHDVEAGQVLIGGVDVRAMRLDDLLDRIAIVFQDTYLLNDSIENNLRLARPEASDADLVAAARAACCHDFIMALPDGYRSVIGEGGGRLSGGERQRLSIARALLKDAPIVLLDEATASIDSGNELAIRQALAALVRGKTVLVIAHRLHTVA
ncbi:ABC transporter ATP-binding protein, partial [Ralstonia pseudosolanacearum]|uniref:ABC transporter ATP-binding protein n=1 Tax=Ralstonia pseudosolanacearum TaxID=1310165 RepID=UPI003D2FED1F